MLKLKDIFPETKKIYNDSDYYLKIKILFNQRELLGKICYWSTSGPKESLLEIGFEYPSGLLFEITLVAAAVVHYQDTVLINNSANEKIGLPLFETDQWKPKINPLGYHVEFYEQEYYLRDTRDCEVYAGKENTTIITSPNTVVLTVINDPVVFGFDSDNNLCYIHMKNMALNEEGFLEQKVI
jgi:hypothetical protein